VLVLWWGFYLLVTWFYHVTSEHPYSLLELSVRWYTVVYIPDVYIECLPRVSWKIKSSTSKTLQHSPQSAYITPLSFLVLRKTNQPSLSNFTPLSYAVIPHCGSPFYPIYYSVFYIPITVLGRLEQRLLRFKNGSGLWRSRFDWDYGVNLTRKLLDFASNTVSHRRRSAQALLTLASPSAQVAQSRSCSTFQWLRGTGSAPKEIKIGPPPKKYCLRFLKAKFSRQYLRTQFSSYSL
jgi:hypothetical protein